MTKNSMRTLARHFQALPAGNLKQAFQQRRDYFKQNGGEVEQTGCNLVRTVAHANWNTKHKQKHKHHAMLLDPA